MMRHFNPLRWIALRRNVGFIIQWKLGLGRVAVCGTHTTIVPRCPAKHRIIGA